MLKSAYLIYAIHRCKQGKGIDEMTGAGIRRATNFWREVLRRVITIILTLASLCLPYRGHHETVGNGKCEGGNFLGLIKMQIDLGDPFLKELIDKPEGATKYLSPTIQNEIINLLGDATRRSLVNKIKEAACFSLIVDSTSDICRVDQISIVVRWVEISTCTIQETFLGFIEAKDGRTAEALSKTVLAYIVSIGLDPRKIRSQGYDGASVMSGSKGGVNVLVSEYLQKNGVESPAPFVHCASHNLNLVINDSVESNVENIKFLNIIEEIYNFFNRSINRSADLKKFGLLAEDEVTLSLKKLCTTRWSSRIDSVRAIKSRLKDIIQLLEIYSKGTGSSSTKEKTEAQGLLKQIVTLEFVLLLNIWEKVLTSINIASKFLQMRQMDLGKSASELERALKSVEEMRNQWDAIMKESTILALKVGISVSFAEKRKKKVKKFYDEIAHDEPIEDLEKKFRVEIFSRIIDTVTQRLQERFKGQQFVAKTFNFLLPKNLIKSSDNDVKIAAKNFMSIYKTDFSADDNEYAHADLCEEILSFKNVFKEELTNNEFQSISDVLKYIQECELTSSYSNLVLAIIIFMTLPVTVASAERSFSKLKLIKTYLRSSIAQDRLDVLAIISIEIEQSKNLDMEKLIDQFAERKARQNKFKV